MKKLTVVLTAVLSLAIINESVYGKSDKSKGGNSGRSEKSERDNNRGGNEKSERGKSISAESEGHSKEKNQKVLDAQENWGHLKKDLEDDEAGTLEKLFGAFYEEGNDYTDKEIKEAIKAEKVVRRELRKNEESLPEGATLERIVNNYLYGDTDEVKEYLRGLEGFDEKSLDRMDKAVEKYDAALDRLGVEKEEESEFDENGEGEGTEVSMLPENQE